MKKTYLLLVILALTACSNTQNISEDYSTYEPVEIIYRKTTYRTVYIPKTYKKVTIERKLYNRCEKERLCRK